MVALPPSRPGAESLSPSRSDSIVTDETSKGSSSSVSTASAGPAVAATSSVQQQPPSALSPPFHSRSTSLDGDVCPVALQTEPILPPAVAPTAAATVAPASCPQPMLSIISAPVVTIDGATPPVAAVSAPQFPIPLTSVPPPGPSAVTTITSTATSVELPAADAASMVTTTTSTTTVTDSNEPVQASRVLNYKFMNEMMISVKTGDMQLALTALPIR